MYELIEEASKVLRTPPQKFDFETRTDAEEIEKALSDAMANFGGIGLSANQVGLDARVFVMKSQDQGVVAFFNPEITKLSQETDLMKEGCLSFPDMYLMIKRAKMIELKYQNALGEDKVVTLEGLASRCVQHEVDHLNGIIFLQRASRLKLDRALKSRPKERARRIDYEKRQALAKYIQSVSADKASEYVESNGLPESDKISSNA
jgi:peptide deformylase|tara:strand:+ start:769 stop:1383 length:615 start_codon:yes stop_codon:yes gene_type:complete